MGVNIQKSHYLKPEQKQIKQEIMEGIFDVIKTKLMENAAIIDSQSTTDIVFSCLVMMAREILVDMIMSTGHPTEYLSGIVMQFNAAVCNSVQESVERFLKVEGEMH